MADRQQQINTAVLRHLGGISLLDRFATDLRDDSRDPALRFLPAERRLLRLCYNTLACESAVDRRNERMEAAREQCRAGNPFPLLALMDGSLRLHNEKDVETFGIRQFLPHFQHLPDYLLEPLLDAGNPPLRLDWWQKVILVAMFSRPIGEIFIKGCTGAGKGGITAMAVCLWYDAYSESRTHVTSRSFEHAHRNMFGEILKWARRFQFPPETLLGQTIGESQRHYVKILNPAVTASTAGEAFSGAHGPGTTYVFDEASSVPSIFVDNAQKNAMKILALSNPRTLHGWFRDAFKPLGDREDSIGVCPGTLGMRLCVTVGGKDCMNVRHERLRRGVAPKGGIVLDGQIFSEGTPVPDAKLWMTRPLISDQIDLAQFRSICSKTDKREVDVFAHGKFPKEDPSKQVIMSSWLERHVAAWRAAHTASDGKPAAGVRVDCFGLDVARSLDGDCTFLAAGSDRGLADVDNLWQYNDATWIADRVIEVARDKYRVDLKLGQSPVCVDVDGVGGGVADILRRRRVWVIEFHGNGRAEVDPRKYANARAEAYALLGRRLNPDDRWKDEPWMLPDDSALHAELCAPEKVYGSDFLRFHISPKRKPPGVDEGGRVVSVAEKLGRSPDKGDGCVYLFNAVRVLYNMNELFRRYQEPLTVAAPGDASGDAKGVLLERAERRREEVGGAVDAGMIGKTDELLAYFLETYGGVPAVAAAGAGVVGDGAAGEKLRGDAGGGTPSEPPTEPPAVQPSKPLRWGDVLGFDDDTL